MKNTVEDEDEMEKSFLFEEMKLRIVILWPEFFKGLYSKDFTLTTKFFFRVGIEPWPIETPWSYRMSSKCTILLKIRDLGPILAFLRAKTYGRVIR